MGCSVVAQHKHIRADSTLIFKYLSTADVFLDKSQMDSAMHYAHLALKKSATVKYKRGEAYAQLKITTIHYEEGTFAMLGRYDSAALQTAVVLKDTLLLALATFQLGQYCVVTDRFAQADQLFHKALHLWFEKKQNENTALIYNDLGDFYTKKGQFDKAVEWTMKAVRLYQKRNDTSGLSQALSNLSVTYWELGNNPQAIRYAKEALALREKSRNLSKMALSCNNLSQIYLLSDSVAQAEKYMKLGLTYAEQSGLKPRIAQSYISLSLIMNRQKKIKEAFEYEKKAIAYYQDFDLDMVANRYIAAAYYCNVLKDSVGAVTYYRKSETLARKLGNKTVLRNVYNYLSGFYQAHNDYKGAYEYYKKYILYRDSLINTETNTKIAELQTQYETEKKDFEIVRLSTLQKIKQLEIEKQKAVIAGNQTEARQKQNAIDLLSKTQELQQEQLRRQADQLEKQRLLAQNNAQQLQLTRQEKLLQAKQLSNQTLVRNFLLGLLALSVVIGYLAFNRLQIKKKLDEQLRLQEMRNSISRNLHDDLGASLSNINILTELAKRNTTNPVKATEYLNKASEDIQHVSESLSDIVWNINPKYDELTNLLVRMRRYAADMMDGKNIGYEICFPSEELKITIPIDQRRDLYLIFKEALNNLVKYSAATQASVGLQVSNHTLTLTIEDNGKGFSAETAREGNGLRNMHQRAQAWKGSLAIHSQPGKGTNIRLTMPLE
jgi:signal transduction histidine kinase